jgi:hypothetical protein
MGQFSVLGRTRDIARDPRVDAQISVEEGGSEFGDLSRQLDDQTPKGRRRPQYSSASMIVRTRVAFFGISWIFGAVLHRLVVVVMFENELLVIDLEAADVVLLARIVIRSEIVERSRELKRPAPCRSQGHRDPRR